MSEPYWEPLAAAPNIATLPDRLGTVGQLLTSNDFNTAVSDGWYWNNLSAANAPGSGLFGLHVVVTANNPTYVRQFAYDYNSPAAYWRQSVSGVWSAWFALIDTGGHVPQATLGTGSAGAGSKFLADDQTYKTVSGGGGAIAQICDLTLSAAQASADTNTILGGPLPTTFNHLRLVLQLRSDLAASLNDQTMLRFNNDSGNNYDYEGARAIAGTSSPFEVFALAFGKVGTHAAVTASANLFSQSEVSIPSYRGTVANKNWISSYYAKWGTTSGTQETGFFGGNWRNNAAITRIQILPITASNFIDRLTVHPLRDHVMSCPSTQKWAVPSTISPSQPGQLCLSVRYQRDRVSGTIVRPNATSSHRLRFRVRRSQRCATPNLPSRVSRDRSYTGWLHGCAPSGT